MEYTNPTSIQHIESFLEIKEALKTFEPDGVYIWEWLSILISVGDIKDPIIKSLFETHLLEVVAERSDELKAEATKRVHLHLKRRYKAMAHNVQADACGIELEMTRILKNE